MERIIAQRKKQIIEVKQILKMQDLLEQYDRQNAFLNHQVDTLLKQNQKLKQLNKLQLYNSNYRQSRYNNHSDPFKQSNQRGSLRNNFYKGRKSRYDYLFDQNQLKDIKSNIKNELKKQLKNQIKQQIIKKTQAKQCQTQQKIKSSQQNLRVSFLETQVQQQKRLSKSKSKQRENSKKKLQVISNSRIYEQRQQLKQSIKKESQIKNSRIQQNLIKSKSSVKSKSDKPQIKQKQQFNKNPYLEESELLQHSFGQQSRPQINLQKKNTFISDMPSFIKQSKQNLDDSRISNKFLPLSIQSKPTLIPKIQSRVPSFKEVQETYHINTENYLINRPLQRQFLPSQKRQIFSEVQMRTVSKEKRNHSLYPSPKIQLGMQAASPNVNPFVALTEQKLKGLTSIQLHRNPSDKIKRKFIKVVSNSKNNLSQKSIKK